MKLARELRLLVYGRKNLALLFTLGSIRIRFNCRSLGELQNPVQCAARKKRNGARTASTLRSRGARGSQSTNSKIAL